APDAIELALEVDQAALPLRVALLGLALKLGRVLQILVDAAAAIREERLDRLAREVDQDRDEQREGDRGEQQPFTAPAAVVGFGERRGSGEQERHENGEAGAHNVRPSTRAAASRASSWALLRSPPRADSSDVASSRRACSSVCSASRRAAPVRSWDSPRARS